MCSVQKRSHSSLLVVVTTSWPSTLTHTDHFCHSIHMSQNPLLGVAKSETLEEEKMWGSCTARSELQPTETLVVCTHPDLSAHLLYLALCLPFSRSFRSVNASVRLKRGSEDEKKNMDGGGKKKIKPSVCLFLALNSRHFWFCSLKLQTLGFWQRLLFAPSFKAEIRVIYAGELFPNAQPYQQ